MEETTELTRPPRRWRRRLVVDEMQYRLLATNLAYFLVGTVIVGAVVFVPLVAEVNDPALPAAQRGIAAGELLALHGRFWPGLVVALVLLGLHSVMTSHRIAGPLYRFRKVLAGVEQGDVDQQVRLRRHDFLVDEAEAINRVLLALQGRDENLRVQGARLQEALAAVEGSRADGADHADKLAWLRREVEALSELVDPSADAGDGP